MAIEEKQLIKWNPTSSEYIQDPYPQFSKCLEFNPVQKGNFSEWILFRHSDIKQILRSDEFYTTDLSGYFEIKEPIIFKNTAQCPYLAKSSKKWLMYLNDEMHLIGRALLEQTLKEYDYDEIVSTNVKHWLDQNFKDENLDLGHVASILPILIFSSFYQPNDFKDVWNNYEKLRNTSHHLAMSQGIYVPIKTYQAINKEAEWLFELISDDFDNPDLPKNSFIRQICKHNSALANPLSKDELISLISLVFFASIETTVDTLTMSMLEMLKQPKLLDFIEKANERQVNVLVEELFRFASPQQYTIRINKNPIEIGGHEIPSGSKLFLCLASANRDPSVFENAQQIVPERGYNPHLAFGSGSHSCIGAKLARLELRGLLKPLALCLKKYRLSEQDEVVWQKSVFMRGIKNLYVTKK
ncbi:cytochrome P450 [Emticicia sp. SJ17W-69]|uniref:cytochrome P450 n=1 Tax=Emticicia sp. SJ17W-69 TaxID=3421657 RepID=UPI003EB8412D